MATTVSIKVHLSYSILHVFDCLFSALNMVGPQYSAQQRTFMAVEYLKRAGGRDFIDEIIADFVAQYPIEILNGNLKRAQM